MGLGDLATSVTDAATSALGVGGGGSSSKPDKASPLTFTRKDPLDELKDKTPLAVGPNGGDTPANSAKTPDQIEFVHYGYVHIDTTNHFPHPKFDNEPGKKPAGRAILYRDALEREALLLYGYVNWAMIAHADLKKSRGAAGQVANAVGSLIGGSGGGSEPDPASLKSLMSDVQTASGKASSDSIDYIKVHKYGIDLQQTRADYNQYCTKKLEAFYLKPSNTNATLMSLPSVAKAAGKVFDILFSAFDIYFAMFLHLRSSYEAKIADACYKFSIDGVKNYKAPTFAAWYKAPDAKPAASTLPGPLASAENDYNKGKKDVEDVAGVDDFPGLPIVDQIFSLFGSGGGDDSDKKDDDKKKDDGSSSAASSGGGSGSDADKNKTKDKIDPADVAVNAAIKDVIGDIPGFLQTFAAKATWISVEFLHIVYTQLCKDGDKAIDLDWLNQTAVSGLMDKLIDLLGDSVSFIKKAANFSTDIMGEKLGTQKLVDKGEDALAGKISPYSSKVLNLIVTQLGNNLKDIYTAASQNKCVTMEVYLGALPALVAVQVRNTMFPVLYLVFSELFGKGNSALDTMLKPVKDLIGKAQDVAWTAKDKTARVNQAADQLSQQGANLGTGGQNLTGLANTVMGNTPKPTSGGGGGTSSGNCTCPFSSRKTPGTGNKIPADDVKKAENDRTSPWPP